MESNNSSSPPVQGVGDQDATETSTTEGQLQLHGAEDEGGWTLEGLEAFHQSGGMVVSSDEAGPPTVQVDQIDVGKLELSELRSVAALDMSNLQLDGIRAQRQKQQELIRRTRERIKIAQAELDNGMVGTWLRST